MIDIAQLEEMFEGDKELIQALFMAYLDDNSQAESKVQENVTNKNFEQLFFISHTLYGTLFNLCEFDITPNLKQLEEAARDGELSSTEDLTKVLTELPKIEQQMQAYIS
ncbi:HPT domain containing protein [Vibrio astriarenae]|uniref:Hpt domain-containing protein n=1 Tax=Vibrio astriarenae TaxID=1481923 RepID=A0A7Z2YFH5_9VIBR|nr:Hpt domain-containing protein [Vibrio astriarenae]QIA65194.1 Hpt domain-containing protein [Vibrio astriarenae]GAL09756.1 HPT domain containing protein [Vibrio sp. C7]